VHVVQITVGDVVACRPGEKDSRVWLALVTQIFAEKGDKMYADPMQP
jgi:hypothetical protein